MADLGGGGGGGGGSWGSMVDLVLRSTDDRLNGTPLSG